MDEASASVDPETDQLIQAAMRNELRYRLTYVRNNCTVCCVVCTLHMVAHSLRMLLCANPINSMYELQSVAQSTRNLQGCMCRVAYTGMQCLLICLLLCIYCKHVHTHTEHNRDCTVLCIAHRLHTIIYYDLVLVLEQGRVAEYAPPLQLLHDENSLFYALCKKSGALQELLEVALSEHEAKAAAGLLSISNSGQANSSSSSSSTSQTTL
jgi:hypothetical protein